RRRDYEGASFEAIAAELHSTPTAVRMHLSRARRKILQTYQALHATGQSDAPPASPSPTPKSPQP
ncbi:MAG: sigma factor-like helix-turn-helix DNA-binding protein, partial [Alloprevotella sp.]|nr:sigma factor-like helix-turn-helix DNA-binding protein [Alloprevotella sp.]